MAFDKLAVGDGEFAHEIKPVLYIKYNFKRSQEIRGDDRRDIGLHQGGGGQERE